MASRSSQSVFSSCESAKAGCQCVEGVTWQSFPRGLLLRQ